MLGRTRQLVRLLDRYDPILRKEEESMEQIAEESVWERMQINRRERARLRFERSVKDINSAEESSLIMPYEAAYLRRMLHNRTSERILCPPTKYAVYTEGRGYRRSQDDKPIKCFVLASFYHTGGGGYVVSRIDTGQIIQVWIFKRKLSFFEWVTLKVKVILYKIKG